LKAIRESELLEEQRREQENIKELEKRKEQERLELERQAALKQ